MNYISEENGVIIMMVIFAAFAIGLGIGFSFNTKWRPVINCNLRKGQRVIGYFPNGDENANFIGPAIFNGTDLISDLPLLTHSIFKASYYKPYPNKPFSENKSAYSLDITDKLDLMERRHKLLSNK
jgi:hypothetical protein